ncbi:MAG TPA: hypothetical protein VGJ15_08730 [Pirellulales bacterium]
MNLLQRALIALASLAAGLAALLFSASTAAAQTVQLPTFHYFTTNTTVEVPDGGDVLLGGVGSASSGRVERGVPGLAGRPFTNSATGRSTGNSSAWVHAEIHDFEAMDRALLGDDADALAAGKSARSLTPAQQLATKVAPRDAAGLAAVKSAAADKLATAQQEAASDLEQGRQQLKQGKVGVAKIYFQNVARHATGDLRTQALIELQKLQQASDASRIAGR